MRLGLAFAVARDCAPTEPLTEPSEASPENSAAAARFRRRRRPGYAGTVGGPGAVPLKAARSCSQGRTAALFGSSTFFRTRSFFSALRFALASFRTASFAARSWTAAITSGDADTVPGWIGVSAAPGVKSSASCPFNTSSMSSKVRLAFVHCSSMCTWEWPDFLWTDDSSPSRMTWSFCTWSLDGVRYSAAGTCSWSAAGSASPCPRGRPNISGLGVWA